MPARLWHEAIYLYRSNSVWRIALEVIVIGSIILVWIGGIGGSSSPPPASYNQTASGVPPRVGQTGGSVIQAPVSPQDLQSDQRLKQFQVAAQTLPSSLSDGTRCERLNKIAQNITGYDRQRARPVHQAYLNEANACQPMLSESNQRLLKLEQAASAYRQTREGGVAEILARARGGLTPFDEGRSLFLQHKPNTQLADQAAQALAASDRRIGALRIAWDQLTSRRSTEAEHDFIVALDAISAFDRTRGAQMVVQTIEGADQEKTVIKESDRRLADLQNALSAYRNAQTLEMGERLQSVQGALQPIDFVRATGDIASDLKEAAQIARNLRQARIEDLVEKVRQGAPPTVYDEIAIVLADFRRLDREGIQNLDQAVLIEARAAEKTVLDSDQRRSELRQAAQKLEREESNVAAEQLFQAADRLQPFDRERLSTEDQQALKLADDVREGIFQSDRRVATFMRVHQRFSAEGCSASLLSSLRETGDALTDQDRERGGEKLANALADVQIHMERSFCLEEKRTYRPVDRAK